MKGVNLIQIISSVKLPEGCPPIDVYALEFLILAETGGQESYMPYPCRPGGSSGITIGIGFDLGYEPQANIQEALKICPDLYKIKGCFGLKGIYANDWLMNHRDLINTVKIEWEQAISLFVRTTLPQLPYKVIEAFGNKTFSLNPLGFWILASLVYNRGTSVEGRGREEMRRIREIIMKSEEGDLSIYHSIAYQIDKMKELWQPGGLLYAGEDIAKDMERRRSGESLLIQTAGLIEEELRKI